MAVIPAFGGSGDQEDDGLSMASGKKNKTLSEIQLKQKRIGGIAQAEEHLPNHFHSCTVLHYA
jgi:hypothetical protein